MTKRQVTARPVETGDAAWGEGTWLVLLPDTPPRTIRAMVAPVGSKDEKWVSLGYDRELQLHFGGAAPTYQDALYAVVEGFQRYAAGDYPSMARTQDPRVKLEPATVVPLALDFENPPRRALQPPPLAEIERSLRQPAPLALALDEPPPAKAIADALDKPYSARRHARKRR